MEATVSWTGGMRLVGSAGSGHAVVMDVAPDAGGADSAATPFELLLLSLAGCTAMDILLILKKQRVDFSRLDVTVHAVRSDEHPRKLVRAELDYVVRGQGVTEDQLKRAVDLSHEKYCSVSATLKPGVEITTKATVFGG